MLWVVFRAESLSQAGKMLAAMMNFGNIGLPSKLRAYLGFLESAGISFVPFVFGTIAFAKECVRVFVLLAIVIFAPNTKQIIDHFRPNIIWITVVILLAVISFVNFSGISDFLYFQF